MCTRDLNCFTGMIAIKLFSFHLHVFPVTAVIKNFITLNFPMFFTITAICRNENSTSCADAG